MRSQHRAPCVCMCAVCSVIDVTLVFRVGVCLIVGMCVSLWACVSHCGHVCLIAGVCLNAGVCVSLWACVSQCGRVCVIVGVCVSLWACVSQCGRGQLEEIHPEFQLWITSEPHVRFPIGLLQMSIKITVRRGRALGPPRGAPWEEDDSGAAEGARGGGSERQRRVPR